uniref:Uncharacterized protein n=1 Tax=Salix viminalis TaxID=40686 RepID=A0A6N2KKA4_SALVM
MEGIRRIIGLRGFLHCHPRVGMAWLCIRLLVRRLLRGLAWLGLLGQVEKRLEVVRRMVLDGVGQIWGRNSRRRKRFAKVLISLLLDKTGQKRCFLWLSTTIIRGFTIPPCGRGQEQNQEPRRL